MTKFLKNHLLAILLIIIMSIGLTNKAFQNDTFYIIKVGESILKNGIDMIDHFSIHNIMYPYEHWLYNIFIYLIYKYYSFTGLYISNIVLASILGIIMYLGTNKLYRNNIISLTVTIISLILLKDFIATRAQLVSYILFILEIYFLESLFKKGKKKYILFLLILSILLANIHAAVWPLFFILYIPYIISFLFYKIKDNEYKFKKFNNFKNNVFFKLNNLFIIENYNNIKYIIISLLVSLFGGLINPNHNQCFTYFIKVKIGGSMSIIQEHRPTSLYTVPLFLIYLSIIFAYFLFFKKKYKLKNIFFIIGLLILSLSSFRHISLFVTIGSFILTDSFAYIKLSKYRKIKTFLFLTIFTVLLSFTLFYNNLNNKYVSSNYPIKVASYINKNINVKKMRLYNEYNYGSYLIYKNIPVFIDSRANLYTKPFNKLDYDIFNDYIEANSKGKYKQIFKRYRINYVLTTKESILDYALRCDFKYKEIYSDKKYILYKKVQ